MRTSLPALALLLLLALVGCADGGQATGSAAPASDPAAAPTADETEPDALPPTDAAPPTAPPSATETPAGPAGETPIPIEGEGDIGDGNGPPGPLAEAPDFGVSSETDSDSLPPHTSCWTDPPGSGGGTCSDGVADPAALVLTGADQLVITYAEGELTAGATGDLVPGAPTAEPTGGPAVDGGPIDVTDLPVEMENPGIWLVDTSSLAPGEHEIRLAWYGEQGDSFAAFTLQIER